MTCSSSIAEAVLGINAEMLPDDAFTIAYNNIMGSSFTHTQLMDELNRLEHAEFLRQNSATDHACLLAAYSVGEVVFGPETSYANTLTSWPSYQAMMEEYGKKIGGTALMIGAITPLSTRAFSVLAEEVYGAEQTVVIDIKGSATHNAHASFMHACGTALPFADNSMGYIHTNRLLHMLRDPVVGQKTDLALQLFYEVGRVLSPGGQVLMEEMPGCTCHSPFGTKSENNFQQFITDGLTDAGIDVIATSPIVMPIGNDYLYDGERDFKSYPVTICSGTDVFARKPA